MGNDNKDFELGKIVQHLESNGKVLDAIDKKIDEQSKTITTIRINTTSHKELFNTQVMACNKKHDEFEKRFKRDYDAINKFKTSIGSGRESRAVVKYIIGIAFFIIFIVNSWTAYKNGYSMKVDKDYVEYLLKIR